MNVKRFLMAIVSLLLMGMYPGDVAIRSSLCPSVFRSHIVIKLRVTHHEVEIRGALFAVFDIGLFRPKTRRKDIPTFQQIAFVQVFVADLYHLLLFRVVSVRSEKKRTVFHRCRRL